MNEGYYKRKGPLPFLNESIIAGLRASVGGADDPCEHNVRCRTATTTGGKPAKEEIRASHTDGQPNTAVSGEIKHRDKYRPRERRTKTDAGSSTTLIGGRRCIKMPIARSSAATVMPYMRLLTLPWHSPCPVLCSPIAYREKNFNRL